MSQKRFAHAAVLGGGMAGLATARVLADHFEKVTLFERDERPTEPGFRPGIPQGRHFHALLPGGLFFLAELLPGFTDDLKAAGSLLPGPEEFYFYRPEGKSYALGAYMPNPRPDDGTRVFFVQTRGLLEHCLRERVATVPNVELRHGTRVGGVVAEDGRVRGVTVGDGETVAADLVIEALGRGGKTLSWLDELGFERPPEDVVNCDFAYTSIFMRPRAPVFDDVGFFVVANERFRGAALVRMEDGTWMTLVGGRHGDYPPKDVEGFYAFAKTVGSTHFTDLLAQADPVGEPAHYRFARGTRRRFEKLARFPEGLLPIGDSICHYNPVYGQGMSAACRQAGALRACLSARAEAGRGLDGLWRDFLPEAYQETRLPWLFATLSDFAHPECTGDRPEEEADNLPLLLYVMERAAEGDAEAQQAMLLLQGLTTRIDLLQSPPWPERLARGRGRVGTWRGVGGKR